MGQPKYKVGDIVYCYREGDFEFTGEVLSRADTGDEWEYDVSNAPFLYPTLQRCLIWESEILGKETK